MTDDGAISKIGRPVQKICMCLLLDTIQRITITTNAHNFDSLHTVTGEFSLNNKFTVYWKVRYIFIFHWPRNCTMEYPLPPNNCNLFYGTETQDLPVAYTIPPAATNLFLGKEVTPSRCCYTLAQKVTICAEAYALFGQVKPTARKYDIQPRQIRLWRSKLDHLHEELNSPAAAPKTKNAIERLIHPNALNYRFLGGGRPSALTPEVRCSLKEAYDKRRGDNYSVSSQLLVAVARRCDDYSISELEVTRDALRKRIHRLLDKWDISWRRGTHTAQNTRHNEKVIDEYRENLAEVITMSGVKPENVFNADQTNVSYSMPSLYTYAARGSRTVAIKGAESTSRCSVMLCCSWTGEKLPSFVVFKGARGRGGRVRREIENGVAAGYPEGVLLTVQERAWFDEPVMLEWIAMCWVPMVNERKASGDEVFLLILDECRTHMTVNVKLAFAECSTIVEYIPGGYTSRLQVLDIGVNKPFKGHLRDRFDEWIVNNETNDKPSRQDVTRWIANSWDAINMMVIKNSWRKMFGYNDYPLLSDEDVHDLLLETPFG